MSPLLPDGDGAHHWLARLGPGAARAANRAIFSVLGFMAFGLLATLLRLTLAPSDEGSWLSLAMLASLPWSLALLWLDPTAGLADRGAWVVALGLTLNLALLLWLGWSLRRRMRRRHSPH